MKKREVKFIQGNYERIKEISNYSGVSFDKVLNVSLLSGIKEYWGKIVKVVNHFPGCLLPENENYEIVQDLFVTLGKKIESEYEGIKEVEAMEREFDEIYPVGYFGDLEIRHEEFIKFLDSTKKRS